MPVDVHSLGLICAGIFVADINEISRHGILRLVSGGIGFLALTSERLGLVLSYTSSIDEQDWRLNSRDLCVRLVMNGWQRPNIHLQKYVPFVG